MLHFTIVQDQRWVRILDDLGNETEETKTLQNAIYYLNFVRKRRHMLHLDFSLVSSSKSSFIFHVVIY